MFTPLTEREAFDTVFQSVERYSHKGLCVKCAILIASEVTGVNADRVEDVWIQRQVELLGQP